MTITGPPPDTLGHPVAITPFRTRSDHAVIALQQLIAYPTGCLITLRLAARRGPTGNWTAPTVADPRCTAHLPDGPITLIPIGTESSSDDHTYHGENRLWLPRLPPPTPFALTLEWPDQGITPATTTLDGAAITQAARHAQPLWP